MNKERICCVRGIFQGIYAWGEGWNSETKTKWDDYLRNYKGIFWRAIEPKHRMESWELVTAGGSVYLHPMDFRTVLHSCGVKTSGKTELEQYFGGQLKELKELCQGLAEACGGKFTTFIAETQVVENNNFVDLL